MAVDYTSLAAVAAELISANGREVEFIRLSRVLDSPTQPWRGTADPRTTPDDSVEVSAVFVHPNSARDLGFVTITPEMIPAEAKTIIVAADSGEDLEDFDEVIDDGKYYKITRSDKLQPGSVPLVYFFVLENIAT